MNRARLRRIVKIGLASSIIGSLVGTYIGVYIGGRGGALPGAAISLPIAVSGIILGIIFSKRRFILIIGAIGLAIPVAVLGSVIGTSMNLNFGGASAAGIISITIAFGLMGLCAGAITLFILGLIFGAIFVYTKTSSATFSSPNDTEQRTETTETTGGGST